jgi:hypothetical protein
MRLGPKAQFVNGAFDQQTGRRDPQYSIASIHVDDMLSVLRKSGAAQQIGEDQTRTTTCLISQDLAYGRMQVQRLTTTLQKS